MLLLQDPRWPGEKLEPSVPEFVLENPEAIHLGFTGGRMSCAFLPSFDSSLDQFLEAFDKGNVFELDNPTLGFTDEVAWCRVLLRNRTGTAQKFHFELLYAFFDELNFYRKVDDEWNSRRLSETVALFEA